jgi:class 3 adenylate cyclase
MGVDINTGEAVVGTIGSKQRLEYTAIGDAINLGSRLESATKDFNVPIIVSEETYEEVKHLFATRYLGEVTVKGKEIPVKIYTVLGALGAEAAVAASGATAANPEAALAGAAHSASGLSESVISTSRSSSK